MVFHCRAIYAHEMGNNASGKGEEKLPTVKIKDYLAKHCIHQCEGTLTRVDDEETNRNEADPLGQQTETCVVYLVATNRNKKFKQEDDSSEVNIVII